MKFFLGFFYLVLLSMLSCRFSGSDRSDIALRDYNSILGDLISGRSIERVYILSSNDCPGCNKKFARWLEEKLEDSGSLIILNAPPTMMDLSRFEGSENVVYRFQKKDTFFSRSKVIYMKEGKIDRVVPVTVGTVVYLDSSRIFRRMGYAFGSLENED